MITAVDCSAAWLRFWAGGGSRVPGATGYIDTDYAAKAVTRSKPPHVDLVCVQRRGDRRGLARRQRGHEVKALEEIDRHIVGPLHAALKQYAIIAFSSPPTIPRR